MQHENTYTPVTDLTGGRWAEGPNVAYPQKKNYDLIQTPYFYFCRVPNIARKN